VSDRGVRFAVDTGGTFTDLVIESETGMLSLHKSPTTPDDPVRGVLDVLEVAARDVGVPREELLNRGELFIHATTRAINAILTGNTARTAFLTTEGHPDVLLYREGGRSEPFNFTRPYPEPYVSRALTFEVPGRIGPAGQVIAELDEERFATVLEDLKAVEVEAIAVCLLWSVVNPAHELRVGELLDQHLPGVPYTLSHRLNPAIREYRRASSAAIDASLKPVMTRYLASLAERLAGAGYGGRVLMVTSAGGVLDAETVADAPIHVIGSGPAMAPVAGRHYAGVDADASTAIVADTGGTSFDVSVVRRGRLPWTRETWLGPRYFGHMTGFPSVDVKSIGAGGGSIAWIDPGGLLHVGPQSASSVPGPVCYGRGGELPTVTDCCLALGYLDPGFFLEGAMPLHREMALDAIEKHVAQPLGLDVMEAASSVVLLATEHMVRAIEEITLNQGIDPRSAALVGGGGAAGFNCVAIARRLGCERVVMPAVGSVLSAAGALMSDLVAERAATFVTSSDSFDESGVGAVLDALERECEAFLVGAGASALEASIEFSAEARYPDQIWELAVPLPPGRMRGASDVESLREAFHEVHQDVFAIADRDSPIEVVGWRARARARLRDAGTPVLDEKTRHQPPRATRTAYFRGTGSIEVPVLSSASLEPDTAMQGPALVELPATTVVVDEQATFVRTKTGSLVIDPAVKPAVAGPKVHA
jgi:N-methylhydantoinase A